MPESEGKEFVINRYRRPEQNLGTTFAKIVKRAGLPEIPRPFDNMRASRSNEIYNRFGVFKESKWIGHSAKTRKDHYDMITDDDYAVAGQWEVPAQEPATTKRERRVDTENRQLKGVGVE
jgi:hypothetical protein